MLRTVVPATLPRARHSAPGRRDGPTWRNALSPEYLLDVGERVRLRHAGRSRSGRRVNFHGELGQPIVWHRVGPPHSCRAARSDSSRFVLVGQLLGLVIRAVAGFALPFGAV